MVAAWLTASSGMAQSQSTGVRIHGSVYGGGNLAGVGGSVVVNIKAGTVDKDVYGGGALANTNTNNWNADGEGYELVSGLTAGTSVVTGLYTKSGESYTEIAANKTAEENTDYYKKVGAWADGMYNTTTGATYNTTTVNLTGGMINGDAYGGGLGRIAESVHYTQEEADAYNSEHNLSSDDEGFKTTADWLPEVKATVYGDINVNLGKTDASSATKFNISKYSGDHSGVVKSGRVFGCNNLNGSPQGNVTVTVYTTVKGSHDKTPAGTDGKAPKTVSDDTSYRVAAVYGGGNLANYAPTATGKKTHVVINGCDDTSIEYVYGGGNAADVPETDVDINEAYEIGTVFGGGNGKDQYTLDGTTWNDNAGADVNGNANTILYGGTIHEAFGGSNEKGTISGSVYINTSTCATCPLNVGKIYGAGKNADINGDLIMVLGCKEARTEEVYGGAENANVKGNVELTITSGEFGKVFGGNNQSGAIFGHIKLNIQETSCTPIKIDELYLGGNEAAYSIYGYYVDGTNPITGKPLYKPRSAEMHNTATTDPNYQPAEDNPTVDDDHPFPYDDPELNIISCESIGMVFGGGFGEGAALYGNPTVNINQTYPLEYDETTKAYKVKRQSLGAIGGGYEKNSAHVDGGVFGGGNEATVYGNTTVNIGTETSVNLIVFKYDENGQPVVDGDDIHQTETITGQTFNKVLGANIVGNVYGGGNKADVTGNTFVNICAKKGTGDSYTSVAFTTDQVIIGGNVFGGGKGVGDSFTCEKAMVGIDGAGADADNYPNYSDGNTTIVIGNGTVTGNVYGGGEIGRVEMNTSVTIGLGDGVASGGTVTSAPEIQHSVFGGGKGLETHGYSALVRGNPTVIIQGNAKVRDNVYGGGQIASVARYNVAKTDDEGAPYGVKKDEPYALKTNTSGFCSVTIRGNAEIGPETIASDVKTTTVGHVFGAGKGILPAFIQGTTKRMVAVRDDEGHITGSTWDDFTAGEADYITFVKTLALASQTNVTIDGNALVKGSVFGGSESGFVQFDTNVNVSGGTIGINGKGGADFGNVYGGGKGDVEYTGTDNNYVDAGIVKGNTKVIISETDATNHPTLIYHNVYGGGAYGTVGEFVYDASTGLPTGRKTYTVGTEVHSTIGGNTEVYITGGTIGTTGSENGMIFGSSRGDVGAPGSIHDKAAWVYDTHVAVGDTATNATITTATPLIKGSVYGGGENGHNVHNAYVRINGGTIGIASGEPITDNNGTPDDTTDDITYSGSEYPYRGNVYGGGCGTDKYYENPDEETHDGNGQLYNPKAGIVQGNAIVHVTAGHIVHNIYGAGAMGSVGKFEKNASTNAISFDSGGKTTIEISGGTIGVDGTVGDGNVFGAARGDKDFTDRIYALVKETGVTVSGTTEGTQIRGNVYGGGEVGNVHTNTAVTVQGGAIAKNVFGGGKGVGDLFTCEQAMVGVEGEGAGANLDADENKDKGTIVTITNGTVGTLNEGALVEGTGNVYGGGEIGRVEWNAQVIIGSATGTSTPVIHGNVFGAGKGLETHGYSALVRGNSTVTVQGGAKVGHCVYGGGENSTVGRYWVKGINNSAAGAPAAPEDLPDGMPYQQQSGGICRVTIQGNAVIGGDNNADLYTGHVFGAGRGVVPHFNAGTTNRMVNNDNGGSLVAFADKTDATTGEVVKTAKELYLEFLQTLSLATNAYVTIDGSAHVKGSVFGGSESGFVQTNTDVRILNGTIGTTASYGNVFGGGRGLEAFAEAGKVKGTTEVTISGGTAYGNVYGGGNLGDVGIITKNTTDYNYTWNRSDGVTANAHYNNTITGTNTNTGICKVTIAGGTIGVETTDEPTKHGNVFGAGRGLADTWWCEKAIAYATNVTVNKGTVYGNVYGGGEVGRVEDDAKVTVGDPSATEDLTIKGSVFGAGAGLATHGYSALVRGNTDVLVQGKAQVGGSVYGGGEIASVGRFKVISGLPSKPQAGGTCTVKIQGSAKIGADGTGHNVYGACKGVTPAYNNTQGDANRSKSMQLYVNCPKNADNSLKAEHVYWDYYESDQKYIWVYYPTEADYLEFLQTLALTSNTHVTMDGSAEVYGSVYGGGERGVTLGGVDVNMKGGTVHQDVYGGGSLADSNRAMWDAANRRVHDYVELIDLIPGLSIVTGYYTKSGDTYSPITASNAQVVSGTQYYAKYKTNVNLTGGTIDGDAYGGGLGRKEYGSAGQDGYVSPIEAMVYGDVQVELNNNNNGGTANGTVRGCAVNRVFGCNNLNGTPKGKVKVFVYATQNTGQPSISGKAKGNYDVQAVYGGGNLAKYEPVDALLDYETNKTRVDAARPEVIVDGCALTSIRQVYGGGNAAPVPATFVEIRRAYEIEEVFGGGNGFDNYSLNEGNTTVWYENPGANVGYYTYASYPKGAGQGTGTMEDPYKAVETPAYAGGADHKEARLAAKNIQYGSGIARLEVKGGTIHTSYGGSNSKGNVRAKLSSAYSAMFDDCEMQVAQSYGGGKNAYSDAETDMVADCAKGVKEMFGGAKDADMDGDINMLITNGSSLKRVFGGNNTSGAVNGSITITLEEGGCEPIKIGELYAGGFLAPYSVYGYEKNEDGSYKTEFVKYLDENNVEQTKLQRIPLESGTRLYKDPRINVISATSIGNIFGGGYQAKLVGNPHINVNMTTGFVKVTKTLKEGTTDQYIYKDVAGNEYAADKVTEVSSDTGDPAYIATTGIGTIGNVYGGGNLADIVGDTYVEIGTGKWVKLDADGNEVEETLTRNAANIKGNVFGGGKGKDDTFQCEKGMVGVNGDGIDHPDGGTYITIGNGTVGTLDGNGKLVEGTGNVYGGGEIGRVEKNTMVTIGLAAADVPEGLTSSPVIEGSVFGGGKGKETHGYAALVRGNPTVIIQGNAKVGHNVYGGGEIASVARYDLSGGVPVALAQVKPGQHSGYCTVIVKDNAEIGPDGMKMYHSDITDGSDKPDDWGHVFGAGKGFLPDNYSYDDNENRPKRMMAYDSEKYNASNREYWEYSDTEHQNVWEYFPNRDKYIEFIQTQALATHTDVTIEGNAFVKGSVYGGSENGLVQYDTDVKITGNCQIGEGEGATGRYTDSDWASESLAGCAHWDFDESSGAPYDPYAKYLNPADGKYYYGAGFTEYAEGGSNIAKDGHTYYGNVFGGGSGSVPYFDTTEGRSVYLNSAGTVKGNTKVTISGGHILTSVYGGCESTNVLGTSTVTMTAGTIGVPRTVEQIQAHPVICNLFGAGKGDQRVFFNKDTNVENAVVNVSGTAKIYGSVFGGGEDGHVLRNSKVTIGDGAVIGAFGYSGYDGNVFGGGRGFGGDALTAGNVSGDVELNINGGSVLGSVYGGGRLASVGYGLYKTTEAGYGEMKDDGIDDAGNSVNGFTRGHVKVNITDGTIGNDTESTLTHTKGGNVFGGSMGRLTLLNGTTNPIWPKLARVKAAEVNIKGGTVKANVYGGGELGTVHTTSKVTVNKGTVNGSVFGGGYGSNDNVTKTEMDGVTYSAVQIAGRVDGTTTVEMNDGQVMKNLYGGGEMASVGVFTASDDMRTFTWGDPYNGTGVCNVTVAGGKIGTTAGSSSAGHVFGAGKGLEDTFWCEKGIVYSTNVNINKGTVNGNVYGGGEVGRVETDAIVKVEGTADIKGNVFGAGAGKETHGYSALVRGNTTVTVQGSAAVGKSVYGGGEIASVGKYGLDNKNMPSILMGGGYCYVTVQGNATVGADVFGAGEGVKSHFNNTDEDLSKRSRRMTLKSDWVSREGADRFDWDYLTESNYPTYLETLALATHPEVTIGGSASIGQSVYGGGELGLTKGSVIVNIKGGTITEDVYGGGSLANTNTTSTVGHTDADGNVTTETVHPTTTVNLLGGTVTRNVYGGGLGQKEVKTGETVTTPGIEAIVYGDVNVNLNGTTTITTDDATGNKTYTPSPNDPTKKGCVVKGNIFGANNVNGTPLGHVLVYVHGTQNETTSALNAKVDGLYDVTGVFGGGNASDYVPDEADTKQSTEVIIEGCDLTSIKEVYGGGYGAAVPATDVLIKGTKIINNVFGGGYGAGTDNPGANVGYVTGGSRSPYALGTGKAVVQLMAGTVNNVYGGSNTKGDIRSGSNVTNVANDNSPGCCDKLSVQEIYGGGSQADMFGGTEIVLGCMPDDWIGAIYAGAENANVGNDVSLTLTSGKFGRVFGGNKSGGTIDGYIEVNIEECPTCGKPGIIIGELYGGGNLAPYNVPKSYGANYQSPRVNVRSFTSIGTIYGGGLGAGAVVRGNPTVNINVGMVQGGGQNFEGIDAKSLDKQTTVKLYPHEAGKIGVIGNVFGGGNAAPVEGNTTVNIGTNEYEVLAGIIPGETDVTGYYIRSGEAPNYVYTLVEPAAPATPETPAAPVIAQPNTVYCILVKGADIQGNVYGGGNAAKVTGHTNVVIGKKAE